MTEKVVITLDKREKDKEFIEYLERFGAIIEWEMLPVGDIGIYGEDKCYGIERKSINDLGNSIASGRLFEQVKLLVENATLGKVEYIPCLLIIGYEYKLWKGNRRFTDAQIAGIENAIQFKWGVKIIHAHNNRFAALRLLGMARDVQLPKESKIHPLRFATRKKMTKEDEARYVLEGFPALSAVRATNILRYYGNLDAALEAMREGTIGDVDGIGAKIAQAVKVVFDYGVEMDGKV